MNAWTLVQSTLWLSYWKCTNWAENLFITITHNGADGWFYMSEHFHLSWIAEGPQWKKSQNPRIHSSYRKGGIQGKLRFYKKWMRKTGSQTKEIDQKDKTHTGKTQGHQKEPKHQEPDKSPEWKQSLRYSQECKNTYNQTHELYHYRSDTVQVWINVLIRYWKKIPKRNHKKNVMVMTGFVTLLKKQWMILTVVNISVCNEMHTKSNKRQTVFFLLKCLTSASLFSFILFTDFMTLV